MKLQFLKVVLKGLKNFNTCLNCCSYYTAMAVMAHNLVAVGWVRGFHSNLIS